MSLTCSIAIATHNRCEDLKATLVEVARLSPGPEEILICADACTDGTEEFIRKHHPECKLMLNRQSLGSIGSREALFRMAQSDLILSLDDDSHPIEPDFIAKIGSLFEAAPSLAVAAFPQRSDEYPETLDQTDFGPSMLAGSFSSSGAVIRRSIFLELGGFPAFFHHAYEEPDFALRCIAAGYQVRMETSLHVRHRYSGIQRDEIRTHHYHARNELWSVVMRCPAPMLLPVAVFRWARQFDYARKRGIAWVLKEPLWWGKCLGGFWLCLRQRMPLPWKQYRQWMQLVRSPQPAPALPINCTLTTNLPTNLAADSPNPMDSGGNEPKEGRN